MTKHGGAAKALTYKDGRLQEVQSARDEKAAPAPAAPPPEERPVMGGGSGFDSFLAGVAGRPLAAGTTVPPVPSTVPAASPTATAADEPEGAGPSEGAEEDAQLFVCTVCQKTFRLQAALQHHYQAKHNMEMPSASAAAATGSAEAAAAASAPPQSAEDATQGKVSVEEYVRQQDGELPQAVQYHLDVAPGAPEEGDIAAHWRCVNSHLLMGPVQEIQEGYVFEDHVLQFTVATDFEGPAQGEPDKDFHTVRVHDDAYWGALRSKLKEGDVVVVSGRLRMVPQYDTLLKKYYHFPVVQVEPGAGCVTIV
ncbi:RNA-editing complex protein [Strigomonas culicis]|nr:RNA-editing complex protein [Strigomonas culicis]|eukprot:EPY19292.1 RNA-editing complex protein [Strigomonas culicis]